MEKATSRIIKKIFLREIQKKLKKFDNRSFLEPSNKQAVTNPDKPVAPPDSASSKQSPAHGGGFGGLESS